ncbi:GGDEF domain-containing protein [Melaminivora suipulveris]|uniref:diguanylate cyclase n=1 Tax=Melaminivora suipulveris TaxID=2109913 RepID=A0A2R3QG69_9BURK|nr:GGDEF domain-containing protein [Melaminivora suipulveris]AVO50742.1 GGDEF domain-containing protein [Melaminivora suipulveris]
MKPLLQNLAEMTAHRDHLRLEVSVLSTLLHQGRDLRVRALELFRDGRGGPAMLRPRSWSEGGQIVSSRHEAADDPQALELAQLPELAKCIAAGARSATRASAEEHVLWLPVWLTDQAHACLEVSQPRPFKRHQRDVITAVFMVYQNYQSLLDYSERDALTGLLNRKTFDEQFARKSAGAQNAAAPGAQPVSDWLAVVDIDHFKQVNDRFGHLYGDEVLILVANRLRSQFRSQDRIFRFGGEEFVVLLRASTLEQARQALDRLRAAIAGHEFPQVGQITVSIGFAAAHGGAPVEILGRADQALYHAKEHGRDQVCYYDDLLASGALGRQVEHSEVDLF